MKNSAPPPTKNFNVHGRLPRYSKYDPISPELAELEATAPLTDKEKIMVMAENPQVRKFLSRLAASDQAKEIELRKSLLEREN